MYDANCILQAAVTKTATFNGAAFDLKTGTPRRGMVARFLITSYISAATAGTVFTPKIQHSADNTTWFDLASYDNLTGGTAAGSVEAFITFETHRQYIRPVMAVSSAAGTPSTVYLCDLGISKP